MYYFEKIFRLFYSRQFWTIVILFIINGIDGIRDNIPDGVLPYLDGVLGLLIVWFRVYPKQKFE